MKHFQLYDMTVGLNFKRHEFYEGLFNQLLYQIACSFNGFEFTDARFAFDVYMSIAESTNHPYRVRLMYNCDPESIKLPLIIDTKKVDRTCDYEVLLYCPFKGCCPEMQTLKIKFLLREGFKDQSPLINDCIPIYFDEAIESFQNKTGYPVIPSN